MQVRIRVGVILAMAAWIMQLSVFLTPIFASQLGIHIGIGYGVCDELAAFSPEPVSATSARASRPAMAGMSMPAMADMPEMAGMDQSVATQPDSSAPDLPHPIAHPSHHPSHGLCGFCLLLGHSVLPPSFSLDTLLAQRATLLRAMARVSDYRRFIPINKTLRPQGRAPPFDFIAVLSPLF